MVERFGAGALLRERTGAALARAVREVRADWEGASARARAAAPVLAAEHDPAHLARVLRDGVPGGPR
jgi:UDP:flavonoid glycosyltransferase YjiC (YdhE family)